MVAESKDQSEGNDALVLAPRLDLRRRAVVPGAPGPDMAAIKRAEQALVELSSSFGNWMREEAQKLTQARDEAMRDGFTKDNLSALFHCAHDIKGQAPTLGYPVVGQMAASLCYLIDHISDPGRIPPPLVNQHVEAIRAMIREHVKDQKHSTAEELVLRLSALTSEVIAAAEADAPKAKKAKGADGPRSA